MNVILCGLPGCGKSTVGAILAEKTHYLFIDTDALIEEKYQKIEEKKLTCRQIFSEHGRDYFRDLEHQVIAELGPEKAIISLGGGALENQENIPMLKKMGLIVYLKGELQTLFKRIQREGLPSYLDPKDPLASFQKIAEARIPTYQEAADIVVEVDLLTPQQIAARIALPIYLGTKLLIKILKSLKCSQYVIITDTSVEPLHGKAMEEFLRENGLKTTLVVFPAGEDYKTRETKEYCENQLLKLGAGRDTCVIGLGGGVVTDLAGFVAATYCRGVPAIMIPTSLLAMVDASIGGKTGVNVPEGKNLIGVITQPTAIFIDSEKLKTLPLSEIKNGLAEMIKHSLIADRTYFDFMKSNARKLLSLDISLMNRAIWDSILIKTAIVQEDEKETGKRRLLNFGHTIAHALETATEHKIAHGRAVAIGTVAESYLSLQMGYLDRSNFDEIRQIFDDFEIDLSWKAPLDPDTLYDLMRLDKKSLSKIPRFVLLKEIGKPLDFQGQYCTPVDESLLKNVLNWLCKEILQK